MIIIEVLKDVSGHLTQPCLAEIRHTTTGGQHCKYNGQRASDINSAEASGHDSHAQHDQKKSLKIYISICFYLLYLKSLLS